MIAALLKAQSLARFAKGQGAPLNTFQLTLTDLEAYELLDHVAAGGLGFYQEHERLVLDVEEAKRRKNPWDLLAALQLQGFAIVPVTAVH